ncbi:MAG: Rpn family recombination-promoting nuclease/putative transposase, partial [Acidobacteriota bacterium]|nr:Rpn family recombination-promoting nuclease/putative transposase [Acidobacteriota bacterium]
ILEIRTLELPKIPETPDVYLWHWLRFLRAETKEELEMVATASPAIEKAAARVMKLSKDEHARMLYEAEMKARDYELVRLHAARTEGRTEGEKASVLTIARNMLELELPAETIIKATGLSFDEIKKLAH